MINLASDNCTAVAPEILSFLNEINVCDEQAYGNDSYTLKAKKMIETVMTRPADIFFVPTGTAANILAVKTALEPCHSLFTVESSHLLTHEMGAIMAATAAKILALEPVNGKLEPSRLQKQLAMEHKWGGDNNLPRLVSISQPSESGTLYSLEELKALSLICKQHNLLLHMDGCRIYNAAVALNKELGELVQFVDLLSLGGTKNGLIFAEALVLFERSLTAKCHYLHKQTGFLCSKMRYLSAQYIPFLADRLWEKYAQNANQNCGYLGSLLSQFDELTLQAPVETNQIFIKIPEFLMTELQKEFAFYLVDAEERVIRLVTSWNTARTSIDRFHAMLKQFIIR